MRRLSIAKFAYVHHPLQDTLILLIRDYESSHLLSHSRAPCKYRRWPLLGSRAYVEMAQQFLCVGITAAASAGAGTPNW